MKNEDMIRMANQIASYFIAYGDAEGVDGTADHIKMFWEPRMRNQLFRYLDETGGKDLSPMALEAAKKLKKAYQPA
ncbi:MAG TPA: formate dehydrogenase subunit delta [Alphaproteobacteria bacterium]|nr:formate dehydrogenase subunit delta [Alphaproteobacteria bacterium]